MRAERRTPRVPCFVRCISRFHALRLVVGRRAMDEGGMKIGIIGAGNVGATLGTGWAKAGHEVIYGVRDAKKASSAKAHEGARFDSVRGAVAAADVVALVTPWGAVDEALAAAGDFENKPLIDVTNPIETGAGFSLAPRGRRTRAW
jgi:predicted dinucleotide-binding enzyme